MADHREEITVDSILASLAKGPEEPDRAKRSWSMSEIDNLLDEDDTTVKYDHYAGSTVTEEPVQMSFAVPEAETPVSTPKIEIPAAPKATPAQTVTAPVAPVKEPTPAPERPGDPVEYTNYFQKRETPKYNTTPRVPVEEPELEEDAPEETAAEVAEVPAAEAPAPKAAPVVETESDEDDAAEEAVEEAAPAKRSFASRFSGFASRISSFLNPELEEDEEEDELDDDARAAAEEAQRLAEAKVAEEAKAAAEQQEISDKAAAALEELEDELNGVVREKTEPVEEPEPEETPAPVYDDERTKVMEPVKLTPDPVEKVKDATRVIPTITEDDLAAADDVEYDPTGEDYDADEEPNMEGFKEEQVAPKVSFMDRLRVARNVVVDFLEGGEEEEEFDEEDLIDQDYDNAPASSVERVTGTELFHGEEPEDNSQIQVKGDLSKGLDSNPASPKMIMELADEQHDIDRAEKRALAGKTVGIHPIHNENIKHQIMTDRIERTGGIMGNDKYRERFLNKPQQKIANTAEYEAIHAGETPEPAERGGYIVKQSKFTNTAGLDPIPTIIAADAELNTFDKTILSKGEAPTIEHEDAEVDGQIKLVGFDDDNEPLPQIDEDHAEDLLRERRTQKVADFRLDSSAVEDGQQAAGPDNRDYEDVTSQPPRAARISRNAFTADYLDDEYRRPKDRARIEDALAKEQRKAMVSTIVQAVCMVLAIALGVVVAVTGGNMEIIAGSAVVLIGINLLLLLVAAVFGIRTLVKGLRGFFQLKINASGATTIVVAAALLQEVVLALASVSTSVTSSMYTGAACLSLTFVSLAKFLSLKRAKDNFTFITNGTQLYATENIDSESDAFEIGRNLLIGEPTICYNSKTRRPKKFVENSFADDPADYDAQLPTLVILGASVLIGLIFGIIRHSAIDGLGVFSALICISVPAFSMLASNIGLFMVDHSFSRTGSAIIGHRAVEESAEINAYAIDSTDIFPEGCCSIVGLKTFHSMRIDDAILYSAALVVDSDSPLSPVFESTILGKKDLLPPVESLAYEEKLGLSAWIHGRRVLFGNRQLLINHNVEVAPEEFENQYTHNGRKVLYLGIAGKVAAMFVIQYRADKRLRSALQNADRAGITLLVRNTDCNINEEMICKYYKLPLSAVKVLSPVSGDVLQNYRKTEKKVTASGILHNGTVEASLKSIYEARRLYDGLFTNSLISLIYSVIAGILAIVLAATSSLGPAYISDYKVVVFQLIFSIIAVGIPALRCRHVR